MTKRKRYSNEFKARVALEAIREELTLAELSKKHGVHPNMISGWKRSAIKNMADGFGKDDGGTAKEAAAEIDKLHSKIGQLVASRGVNTPASRRCNGIFWRAPRFSCSGREAKNGEPRSGFKRAAAV